MVIRGNGYPVSLSHRTSLPWQDLPTVQGTYLQFRLPESTRKRIDYS